jgi:hypothetical protein
MISFIGRGGTVGLGRAACRVPGPPVAAPEIYDDRGTQRLLLRLDGFVHNRGEGAFEMRGSSPADVAGQRAMGAVVQRVYDPAAPGGFRIAPAAPACGSSRPTCTTTGT